MMFTHSRWLRLLGLLALATSVGASRAQAAIDIVATTEDLASIVKEVGGDKVKVEAIARGYQDPHFVEPKPSFILKLHGASLLVLVGRELEIGWLPPLVQQSRNAKIQPGADGYLDASQNVRILEIPTGQITRAMGDVHPQGNPHYWLDPENGRKIAQAVQAKLSALTPADAAYFAQRFADFDRRLAEALVGELRRPVWPRRHRLRRAEAGHSADAVAYARRDPGNEAPERQADSRRALLRSEDAAIDRSRDRC
jgi:zinc/manganese transport system substrate-binding protein